MKNKITKESLDLIIEEILDVREDIRELEIQKVRSILIDNGIVEVVESEPQEYSRNVSQEYRRKEDVDFVDFFGELKKMTKSEQAYLIQYVKDQKFKLFPIESEAGIELGAIRRRKDDTTNFYGRFLTFGTDTRSILNALSCCRYHTHGRYSQMLECIKRRAGDKLDPVIQALTDAQKTFLLSAYDDENLISQTMVRYGLENGLIKIEGESNIEIASIGEYWFYINAPTKDRPAAFCVWEALNSSPIYESGEDNPEYDYYFWYLMEHMEQQLGVKLDEARIQLQ